MADVFAHTAQMRFSDTDAMGHVNNARFLSYLEDARIAFLSTVAGDGAGFMESGLILARIELDYVAPIEYAAGAVVVEAWMTRIGTKSFGIDYRITQGGAVVARATSVLVAYDYATGASRAVSAAERVAIVAHLPGEGGAGQTVG